MRAEQPAAPAAGDWFQALTSWPRPARRSPAPTAERERSEPTTLAILHGYVQNQGVLEPLRHDPSQAAVLLDIDGTLAPIVRHAADAHVPEATRALLIEIAKRYRIVGCISGRRAATARQIVAIGTIAYIGNHGGELLLPGATRPELDPDPDRLCRADDRPRPVRPRVVR